MKCDFCKKEHHVFVESFAGKRICGCCAEMVKGDKFGILGFAAVAALLEAKDNTQR